MSDERGKAMASEGIEAHGEQRYVTDAEQQRMRYPLPPPERIFDWFPCPKCARQAPMINPGWCAHFQMHECPGCRHVFEVN